MNLPLALTPKRSLVLPVLLGGLSLACATAKPAGKSGAEPAASPAMPQRVQVPLIDHHLAPAQIAERLQAAQAECDKALAALVAVPDAQRTFANTPEAMELALDSYGDTAGRLSILKDIHPDEKVREASAQAEETAGKYMVQIASRRDLYRAIKGYLANAGTKEPLDEQQKRLLELTMRDFRRNGLELPDDKLARLVALRTRLTELSTEFSRNLNENVDSIQVTQAELAGVPEPLVQRLKKAADGRVIVTTKYPDYIPFMENASSGEARRRLYVAFQSREAARNLPLLQEALTLRDEEARLLGYPNHADFVTEDQMARTSKTVATFLADLKEKLRPLRDRDLSKMTELKRQQTGDKSAKVDPWDVAYYLNQIKKRDFALDGEALRDYFPAQTVLEGMFKVYETLFSIDIREVKGADLWAPEVKLYEIRDRPSGAYVASFYMDLFPRPGKYGHAASASVTMARQVGPKYLAPVALIMANFNPPSGDRPSLLSFEEVRTMFHEFGHVMHQTLTSARYGSQAGTAVARDFVEAPSQMLENWVYEKPALDLMSGDFRDPSQKLPAATFDKLLAARSFDAGWRYTRQVFLASFDQALHTAGPKVNPDEVDQRLYTDILGLTPVAGTHFAASFGHLMGGYDAGYYGYLWSEVFADDMFAVFKDKGVLSPEVGRRYRDIILAKGKSEEPEKLLRDFLGREPNNQAFLKTIGLEQ